MGSASDRVVVFSAAPKGPSTGPQIRARQFRSALKRAKHSWVEVLLGDTPALPPRDCPSDSVVMRWNDFLDPETVAAALGGGPFRAVVGVGSLMPSAAATRFGRALDLPVWADLFGDPLAELHAAQTVGGASAVHDADAIARRDQVWDFQRSVLLGADTISVVSSPQRAAVIGQLALLGRLGASLDVAAEVIEVPCAVPFEWTLSQTDAPEYPERTAQGGQRLEGPYLYFGGTWNAWLDGPAIGRLAARLMDAEPSLAFVVAGIPTGGGGETVFRQVLAALGAEGIADDRILQFAAPDMEFEDALLAHATASVILDRPIPESFLGSRNRLLAMVRWGATPFVSPHSELARQLVDAGLAVSIAGDEPTRGEWTSCLSVLARTPEQRDKVREAGRRWLRSVTFEATTEPLEVWLRAPRRRSPANIPMGNVDRWAAAQPTAAPARSARFWSRRP